MTRFSPDTRVRVVKDLLAGEVDWTGREGTVVIDPQAVSRESRAAVRLDGMKVALHFDDEELEAVADA